MMQVYKKYSVILIILTLWISSGLRAQSDECGPNDPLAVYLTWQHNPSTTMTIHWISDKEHTDDVVYYQNTCNEVWHHIHGSNKPMPQGHPYLIHCVEITNLKADHAYRFRFGNNPQIYKFRTMPADLSAPIRFVVGGDIYHDSIEAVRETNKQAAKTNPHFALAGGDLAYSSDKMGASPENAERWLTLLSTWKKTMIAPDGRLIPIVPTIGNHETQGRYKQTPEQAQFFYALFSMPGPQGYNVLDFGNYMSIFILDSGHTHPVEGPQTEWLETVLKERGNIPNKFALYHVPAYPSVRQFETKASIPVRTYWPPLFEKYGVTTAFEHHDHDYKRTVRIKNGKEDSRGVLYMGDGAWGISQPRLPKTQKQAWYLAKTAPVRHFILVTLQGNRKNYQAIDSTGQVFDTYEIND